MADKNVAVALRIRPLVPSELAKGCADVLEVYSEQQQVRIRNTDKSFTFNHVFGTDTDHADFYTTSVRHTVDRLFDGYNVTILAYGQTGSGKTYTMGTTYDGAGEMGVIPRAVHDMFAKMRDNFAYSCTVTVSFMELYQEVLYDLLAVRPRDQCVLEIREDATKSILISGLTEVTVAGVADVFAHLNRGSQSRATGSTNMNAQSSRSHAIFTVNITMQHTTDVNDMKSAKFNLVDLAGSERPKKTGAVGQTFREGVNINKGLLVLGNVISALGDDKQQHGHIPYRDSNLTRLLKDSLGGNSITLMIACVSPADYNLEETLSTLRYADRARKIRNRPIVNEDPQAAEINQLRTTVKQLQLQIIGQGGPSICPAEIELMRRENLNLRTKIRDLTLQLSATLNNNTGLLEKLLILQNANDDLHRKINAIRHDYDHTLSNISVGIDEDNIDAIRMNVTKLESLRQQFIDINSEQKRTETEIRNHEHDVNRLNNSSSSSSSSRLNQIEPEINDKQESHTNKQMALNNELQELTKNLAMKEDLAQQIEANAQYMVDYQMLTENENKILTLQKEKDELMQQLKCPKTNQVLDHRKKRVAELEAQIHELNRKVQEQARLIKLKDKDEQKIRSLNSEILQMKQAKVRLIRNMREESVTFKAWKMQRERELVKLKQQDQKKQNQIVKMELMHNKQQNVLKRKVEEAVSLNKRLKDALALRKNVHDAKNTGKIERIGQWIRQELNIHLHIVEAELTLNTLLDDRATLRHQYDELMQNPDANADEIKIVDEDIALRSVQIQELQQKLLDSDEENKSKTKFDKIQTMSEAKYAIRTLFDEVTELKKKEVTETSKVSELETTIAELNQQIINNNNEIKRVEQQCSRDIANLEQEHQERVAVLLRQIRGVAANSQDDEQQPNNNNTPETKQSKPVIASTSIDLLSVNDNTFVVKSHAKLDDTVDDDDTIGDPDWRKTPLGKWLKEKRSRPSVRAKYVGTLFDATTDATATAAAASRDRLTFKRNSDGGCTCSKGCTGRCGCRRNNRLCSGSCKCSTTSCQNRLNVYADVVTSTSEVAVDDDANALLKKPRFQVEDEPVVDGDNDDD